MPSLEKITKKDYSNTFNENKIYGILKFNY